MAEEVEEVAEEVVDVLESDGIEVLVELTMTGGWAGGVTVTTTSLVTVASGGELDVWRGRKVARAAAAWAGSFRSRRTRTTSRASASPTERASTSAHTAAGVLAPSRMVGRSVGRGWGWSGGGRARVEVVGVVDVVVQEGWVAASSEQRDWMGTKVWTQTVSAAGGGLGVGHGAAILAVVSSAAHSHGAATDGRSREVAPGQARTAVGLGERTAAIRARQGAACTLGAWARRATISTGWGGARSRRRREVSSGAVTCLTLLLPRADHGGTAVAV